MTDVISPFNGEVVGKVSVASKEIAENAIESAYQTFHQIMKKMPTFQRTDILRKTADLLEEKKKNLHKFLC